MLARSLGIACAVFFGSGSVIPFTGWGLIVWGIIFIVIAVFLIYEIKKMNIANIKIKK